VFQPGPLKVCRPLLLVCLLTLNFFPDSSRFRRHPPSLRLATRAKPPAPSVPKSGPSRLVLPAADQVLEELPDVPLHGSADASLPDLLHWRAEFYAARDERQAAKAAHEAAIDAERRAASRLSSAVERGRTAQAAFVLLMGQAYKATDRL
jgi:hypothetical protein